MKNILDTLRCNRHVLYNLILQSWQLLIHSTFHKHVGLASLPCFGTGARPCESQAVIEAAATERKVLRNVHKFTLVTVIVLTRVKANKAVIMSDKKAPDMELKKAFGELQAKMLETQQKMKLSDLQIENFKRSMTHAQLTDQEIGALPEDAKLYESVGRMFIISSKEEVAKGLTDKQATCREKIKNLQSNKEYLERNLKESENSLRELIVSKKGVV